jgi:hypothetical protein
MDPSDSVFLWAQLGHEYPFLSVEMVLQNGEPVLGDPDLGYVGVLRLFWVSVGIVCPR